MTERLSDAGRVAASGAAAVRRGRPGRRRGVGAAVALIAVVAVLDVVEGPAISYVGIMTCAPFLAAVFARPADVAAVGALAVAVGVAVGASGTAGTSTAQVVRLSFIVAVTCLAVLAARLRERRDEQVTQLIDVAQVAQSTILRPVPAAAGPLTFAARYASATAAASIGGDLYDVANTPHGVRLVIGDVRGKGLDAVRLAGAVLAAFREAAFTAGPDLRDVARQVSDSVARQVELEDFVTAAFLQLDAYGRGHLVNCGHPPPLLITTGGAVTALDDGPSAPPLGLATDVEATPIVLPPAHRLLLYTDGLTEARDPHRAFFDLDVAAATLAGGTLDDALTRLLAAVDDHTHGGLHDDLALVLAEHHVVETPTPTPNPTTSPTAVTAAGRPHAND